MNYFYDREGKNDTNSILILKLLSLDLFLGKPAPQRGTLDLQFADNE